MTGQIRYINQNITSCGQSSLVLWTKLFNIENSLEKVSYYAVQQIIKNEKHLFKIGESKDDCRCEKYENVELLLSGIKQSLKKMVVTNWFLH